MRSVFPCSSYELFKVFYEMELSVLFYCFLAAVNGQLVGEQCRL